MMDNDSMLFETARSLLWFDMIWFFLLCIFPKSPTALSVEIMEVSSLDPYTSAFSFSIAFYGLILPRMIQATDVVHSHR